MAFYHEGKTWVVYFVGKGDPVGILNLTPGKYKVTWLDPGTLHLWKETEIELNKDGWRIDGPGFAEDFLMKVTRLD